MKKSSRMFLLYSYDVFGETTVYLRHSRNIFVQYECVAKKNHIFSFVKCHEQLLFVKCINRIEILVNIRSNTDVLQRKSSRTITFCKVHLPYRNSCEYSFNTNSAFVLTCYEYSYNTNVLQKNIHP